MSLPLGKLGKEQFLRNYWQKQPVLIQQAIAAFEPQLDGDDLAGLACEETAESRLIQGNYAAADWTVTHGPFSDADFSALGDENWTLLVQDVEKYYAPLQALLHQFNFIPNWRLDDLMISYSARGGSVGPHTDQYDVFLLQAEGKRSWQIARYFDGQLLEGCPLNVLKEFTPEQEWILEPGDILYLPPNVAHHGVALEPGMTWSIGCRAPSAADLLQGLGEWLAFSGDEGGRYSDPDPDRDPGTAARAGEIDPQALLALRGLMLSAIEGNKDIDDYIAAFMSRFRLANEPVPPAELITSRGLLMALEKGGRLLRNPWTRITWIETGQGARLYASGQPFDCSTSLAEILCHSAQPRIKFEKIDQDAIKTLTDLVNHGHFLLL